MAAQSGFRFFTVGVGSAVSEAFVQTLADATGGACELVSPREDMADKMVRHFKRIYFPRAGGVRVNWPGEPVQTFPARIGTIYDGDTVHVFGRFSEKPEGDVELTAELENGETFTQKGRLRVRYFSETGNSLPGTMARMAAACEIGVMADEKKIAAVGVQYQLMTRHTNYLAIDIKADNEKAVDLPALRKTPQMLAAGWGGSGMDCIEESLDFDLNYMEMEYAPNEFNEAPRQPNIQATMINMRGSVPAYPDNLNKGFNAPVSGFFPPPPLSSINDLVAYGIPEDMIEGLNELKDSGVDEQTMVIGFLHLLAQKEQVKKKLTRSTRRIIVKAFKELGGVSEDLRRRINAIIDSHFQIGGNG